MKKLLLLSAILLFSFGAAHAQISSTVTTQKYIPGSSGNDFWFAAPSNQWGEDLGGNYIRIYITSQNNCTAYVASQYSGGLAGTNTPIPITAREISSYKVPEFWEMESSGIAENKAIHVYSNDANITVTFISVDPNESANVCVIPTIGWDTEYVVTASGSFFDIDDSLHFDYPSECNIVADADSTLVSITPTCDCRKSTSGNPNGDSSSAIVAFPAGQTFSILLNQGQSMQLMPVRATDAENFDLTGTIIHANHPIGVIGGAMYAEIPAGSQPGNFLCNMLPPVSGWGQTCYSNSFLTPSGTDDSAFSSYVFISSEPGQVIYRSECGTTEQIECVIPDQYGLYRDALQGPQKFFSSAPFLAISSISNEALYPAEVYPAELTLNPREHFAKSVIFETPLIVLNVNTIDNQYANLIVNDKDAKNVTFDGKSILGYGAQCLDDTFEIFNIPNIASSAHVVTSDSGVELSFYGYGTYSSGYGESYALSGPIAYPNINSPDTVAPLAVMSSECYHAFLHVSDSGLLPNGLDTQTGLAIILLDSAYNMNVQTDPDWEGSGTDTSGYSISVIDPTKPAIAMVQVYDLAGNITTITSTYKTNFAMLQPPLQNLGVWDTGTPPNVAFDTIVNEGQTPFDLSKLHLQYGNMGFSLFDSTGGTLDLSPIPVGGRRVIEIQFVAQVLFSNDSIVVGNMCDSIASAIIGSGDSSNFLSVQEENNSASATTILPVNDGRSLEIILPIDMAGPVGFQLFNVLGESVLCSAFSAGTQTVDASMLPRGVYFYRLTSSSISQNGKVILGE